jgi:hypothetical protein
MIHPFPLFFCYCFPWDNQIDRWRHRDAYVVLIVLAAAAEMPSVGGKRWRGAGGERSIPGYAWIGGSGDDGEKVPIHDPSGLSFFPVANGMEEISGRISG